MFEILMGQISYKSSILILQVIVVFPLWSIFSTLTLHEVLFDRRERLFSHFIIALTRPDFLDLPVCLICIRQK